MYVIFAKQKIFNYQSFLKTMEKEEIKKMLEYIKNRTPEEEEIIRQKSIKELKERFSKKQLQLKKWRPPKENLNWSHDHCDFCQTHISNKENSENEAYTDEEENDWICKSCFKKYLAK
jgi:hypothetical protein